MDKRLYLTGVCFKTDLIIVRLDSHFVSSASIFSDKKYISFFLVKKKKAEEENHPFARTAAR